MAHIEALKLARELADIQKNLGRSPRANEAFDDVYDTLVYLFEQANDFFDTGHFEQIVYQHKQKEVEKRLMEKAGWDG